ncbi:MAG: isocitrate lyase, partial [Thermodesulfobacteriota bacterium]
DKVGLTPIIDKSIQALKEGKERSITKPLENAAGKFVETWEVESGLMTYAQAVAEQMEFAIEEGRNLGMTIEEWFEFAKHASYQHARDRAKQMGIEALWDCELSRTPEGYYQVKGGIEYAIAKSLAVAPYADLIWMETKTANYEEAREFAEAFHAEFPDKMLAYNLSPSFNWDTTGMSEEEMRNFPKEIGKLGYVFDFITYGGHQIDGLAAEEFATALKQDGMLALARLQRKFRLLDSPYRTPQTLVGGPRLDGALAASSGRTATTVAMGKGSTQIQHLVETEVPPRLLEDWLELWSEHYGISGRLSVKLRPHTAGSELLELSVSDEGRNKVADVIFATIHDRWGNNFVSIRDQNTFDKNFRQKRLMALLHLFLIHRYKAVSIHYVSPTEDNQKQAQGMKAMGIYDEVNTEIGHIIVARVNSERVKGLLASDLFELKNFIAKKSKPKGKKKEK